MDSKDIERWIQLQSKECAEQYPNQIELRYASLSGRFEGKLRGLFAGEIVREAAIRSMKEDLEVQ